MRVQQRGYEIILEQRTTLVSAGTHASSSKEMEDRFQKKWGNLVDPYYSKHLRKDREDTSLKIPSTTQG